MAIANNVKTGITIRSRIGNIIGPIRIMRISERAALSTRLCNHKPSNARQHQITPVSLASLKIKPSKLNENDLASRRLSKKSRKNHVLPVSRIPPNVGLCAHNGRSSGCANKSEATCPAAFVRNARPRLMSNTIMVFSKERWAAIFANLVPVVYHAIRNMFGRRG